MGRSHLQAWRGRQRELLSDQELVAFLFATMHPDIVDIREQFPLNLQTSRHEANSYQVGHTSGEFPGTIELAEVLKIKHPIVREDGAVAPWIMTTDLLLTLRTPGGFRLLAISVKPSNVRTGTRTESLLALERQYWTARSVPWLLITPAMYNYLVSDFLKGYSGWALKGAVPDRLTNWLCERVDEFDRRDLTSVLHQVEIYCGCGELAKNGFWGAVWAGKLPFDLQRSWRPSSPLILLPLKNFWELNPVISGRSAWAL